MKDLTLSDLIALREFCYDESLGFSIGESEHSKWYERFKLVDKELSERVEKIFGE